MPKYNEYIKRKYMDKTPKCNAANKAKEDGHLDEREQAKMINCGEKNFYRCEQTDCPYHT
jgi:hypothetical protein